MLGTAAALIQLSNMINAQFTLNSNLPLELAWDKGDPSSGWISTGVPITEHINYTNIAPVTLTDVIVTVVVTCPVGMTSFLCNMYFYKTDGLTGGVLSWTGSANVFTAVKALTDFGPNVEGQFFWQITIYPSGALDGVYSMSIVISGSLA